MSFLRRVFGLPPATLAPYATPKERLDQLERTAARPERRLIEWARELAGTGEVVWEAGAGTGVFAYAAAIVAGPNGAVLAVERDPVRAAALRQAARGLGARDARLDLLEVELVAGADGLAPAPSRGAPPADGTATLDELLARFRPPTLLRLGSSEAAPWMLAGAARILGETQPVLLIEVRPRDAGEIGALLQAHGYRLYDAETNPRDRMYLEAPPQHTLAIPR